MIHPLVLEALFAGFYVNVTRSLAPIFMASSGMSLKGIIELNLISYIIAFVVSVLIYHLREKILAHAKGALVASHVMERVLWCSIPIAYSLGALRVVYPLAVTLTVPTSALISVAIYSPRDVSLRKSIISRRSSFGAVSNLLASTLSVAVLFHFSSREKYLIMYLLALAFAAASSVSLVSVKVEAKIASVSEEVRVKYVNVALYLVLLSSSAAILGVAWTPHLVIDLGTADYVAATVSAVQTAASIVSPIFWQGRRYQDFRAAVLALSPIPAIVGIASVPSLHIVVAAVYAFLMTGANILAAFLFAELAVARDRLAFLSPAVTSASQLVGMSLAVIFPQSLFFAASLLALAAAVTSILTIPELAIDAEKAAIYSRTVYNLSISGYAFSAAITREAALFVARLAAVCALFLILTFLYRLAYYLAL